MTAGKTLVISLQFSLFPDVQAVYVVHEWWENQAVYGVLEWWEIHAVYVVREWSGEPGDSLTQPAHPETMKSVMK